MYCSVENTFKLSKKTHISIKKGFGIIIISPEPYIAEIKYSFNTSKLLNDNVRVVISKEFSKNDIASVSNISDKLDITDKNISSMINFGVERSIYDWNFIIFAGAKPTKNLIEKYFFFCTAENDILYPIVNRRLFFPEASINGLFFNRKFTPKFIEKDNLQETKLYWATELYKNNLKGIVGANFS